MTRRDWFLRAGAVALAAAIAWSCGGGGSPASSTPATTRPTVTTTPTTTLPSYLQGCPLGEGTDETSCTRGRSAQLLDAVGTAIDLLAQQGSRAVDPNDLAGPGSYNVVDRKAFIDGVVGNLRAAGYCAQSDYDYPTERINVKNTNDFSEDFDLILGTGYVRRGMGAYRQTCTPAAFPVEPNPNWPPSGSGCGKPYPPPITSYRGKIYLHQPAYDTLDSTAWVGPDGTYCQAIGFTDNRTVCPVRVNGDPERLPCEEWAIGHAKDTGRAGPTWTNPDGEYCKGLTVNGCENHPENQSNLLVVRGGTYHMCADNGVCGRIEVDDR